MLFVELALIRWAGETVLYVSFFANFVLLGSFLGIGIGFIRAAKARPIYRWSPTLLTLLVGTTAAFPVEIDRTGDGLIYFGQFSRSGLPAWVVLPLLFIAVAAVMATIADGTARLFGRFEPLTAYRLDILGAIAGTTAFAALAFIEVPPIVWGIVVAALMLTLIADRGLLVVGSIVGLLAVLLMVSFSGSLWSPYYRIDTTETDRAIYINVNRIPHQAITTVEDRLTVEPFYQEPYLRYRNGPPESVLIIGAGNGTDVAIALANGVDSVDAVEIDPVLYRLGEELHPDRPYQDPRVDVTIDDGRAFMQRTDRTYDMVLYALPDSLTLVSGQASLRLESYLFTMESLERVRELLDDDGVFAMYNFYRESWLVERLGRMLEKTFGEAPCVQIIGAETGLAVLMVSADPEAIDCSGVPAFDSSSAAAPVTDDKPFLYLDESRVPTIYLAAVILILLASVVGVRGFAGPLRGFGIYIDLFFMGAAFLLLETKTIVQFSLLFGSTWFVNALVFAGILVSVLGAIEVAKWRRLPGPPVLYSLLFVALFAAWLVPPSWLLTLDGPVRFAAGVALAFTPVFAANLIFAQRFKDTASSTTAFGVNLLGAMLGGVLEYAALWIGYRWLTVLVVLLYLAALLTWRRMERVSETAPRPATS
ncbi:MAG: spermidine synthase [Actinomycetota bacterium]|nr:spermidine synthase [Actinomycetota bacterium]